MAQQQTEPPEGVPPTNAMIAAAKAAQVVEGLKSATSTQGDASSVAADQLKSFIERVERLQEEKDGLTGDIKDVYAEMKGTGFDANTVKHIIRIRRMDHAERQEKEAILELYMQALGMGY